MKLRNCLVLIAFSLLIIFLCNQKMKSEREVYFSQQDSIQFLNSQKELTNSFVVTNDRVDLGSVQN